MGKIAMEDKNIVKKLDEWTKGRGPIEKRISIFQHIRDIPYEIVPELRDPDKGPSGILALNKGSCQPKHWLLGFAFGRLNIPVKYVTYTFNWYDPEVKWPSDLINIVKELPASYHLACKAYIDDKWVAVDATWDPPLKKAGFRVNEAWDGVSDTLIAVNPLDEIMHESAAERVRYETEKKSLYTEEEKAMYAEFIEKLNRWLNAVRRG